MKTTGKLVTALTIGTVAGVVAGILLAPAKGTDTRKKIAGNLRNGLKKGKEQLGALQDSVKNGIKQVEKFV